MYWFWINIKAGVIIVPMANAPQDPLVPKGTKLPIPPPPRRLSDVMCLTYMNMCGQDIQCLQKLRWVIHYNIGNTQSLGAIQWLFGNPPPNYKFKGWPGRGYDLSTQNTAQPAQALVGIPNGKGIAYMLLQHNQQFGPRTIDRVQVFGSDYGGLCVAWRIAGL